MKGGYFLQEDIRAFDNEFFGINNMEATYMDPQQRKLLEVVFECLESAGLPLEKVSGSNTGCYVGNFTTDFMSMQTRDTDELHRYNATGAGLTILSNRISHVFNLTGPSVVLDTACSSSLYCLHAACSALQIGDCDGAIVAAANLIQSVEQQMMIMKAGVLSKTSTCHTFDNSADGYGRADGLGALFLKRLSDAIRDGDPIRSVIRGTAVNANGRTQGITLPSADGQESVMRKAYAAAGLKFDQTGYVECHGTGKVLPQLCDKYVDGSRYTCWRSDRGRCRVPCLQAYAGSTFVDWKRQNKRRT
jgi:acyl transferase domain-containing protein